MVSVPMIDDHLKKKERARNLGERLFHGLAGAQHRDADDFRGGDALALVRHILRRLHHRLLRKTKEKQH